MYADGEKPAYWPSVCGQLMPDSAERPPVRRLLLLLAFFALLAILAAFTI